MSAHEGRLIKDSNKKLLASMNISPYSWLDFNTQKILFPDNSRKNIVLNKLHDPQEMDDKVTNPQDFFSPLVEKADVLFPVDLTNDYEERKKEIYLKQKRNMMDEDEIMAFELAEIKDFESQEKEDVTPPVSYENILFSPERIENKEIYQNYNLKQIEEKYTEAHTEGYSAGKKEGFLKGESEGKEYAFQEGYKNGFLEGNNAGFTSGEERGMRAAESKYEEIFTKVSEAAIRMDKLKTFILEQGQEIFLEVTQICCEKILREQLKYSDKSLLNLFKEISNTHNKKSSLTIEMNPLDVERMKPHLEKIEGSERIALKQNNSYEIGNFQVESDTGVSIFDLKESIKSAIEELKKDLFNVENNLENSQKDDLSLQDSLKKAV